MQLIEAAARLLKSDIKEATPTTNEWYPLSDDLDLKGSLLYLPECVCYVQNSLLGRKQKKMN